MQMPAIHDFGLFMALIVSSCWLTVFCTIPPALNLWQRYAAKWETWLYQLSCGKISCIFGSGGSDLPGKCTLFNFTQIPLQNEWDGFLCKNHQEFLFCH